MTFPRMDSVWALYALQKSMMLTPCGPRAVPTGGAGVAAPACSWTLTSAAIFFLGGIALRVSFVVVRRGHREPDRLCHLALLGCPSYVGNRTILVPFGPDVKSASTGVRRLCRRSSLSRPRGPVSVSSDQVSRRAAQTPRFARV